MHTLIDEWFHHILPLVPFFMLYFTFTEFISQIQFSFSFKHSIFILLLVILVSSIPQCSITILMVYLFYHHKISFGSLVASFIAMNDESIFLLFPTHQSNLFYYILIKMICALITGLLIDKWIHKEQLNITHFIYNHHHSSILSAVLIHTFQMVLFLTVVFFLEELIFAVINVKYLLSFFSHSFISRIILMLMGLIPGCSGPFLAYSLLNSQFISFSVYSCVLTTCNGFGLVVLCKNHCTKNILIYMIVSLLCNALLISFLCEVLI